jgi:hypothetical protein
MFKHLIKKLAELVSGIDVVIAIVLRPDLLRSDLLVSK